MFVCIALLLAMTLVVSCENKTPTAEKFTVTFDPNGGGEEFTVEVERGKAVAKPNDPTRRNYTFVEWQLDGTAYDFKSPVTKNLKLKAIWQKIQMFESEQDIIGNLNATMALTHTGYNTPNATGDKTYYTEAQFKDAISNFSFYSKVGKVKDSVVSVKLGTTTFNASDEVVVSMGNNIYVKDKAFIVNSENELYVAAPVMAVELSASPSFEVIGNNWNEIIQITEEVATDMQLTKAVWNGGTNLATIDTGDPNKVTLTIKDSAANKYVGFVFNPSSTWYLTKKTYKDSEDTVLRFSYGYTSDDPISGGSCLGLYPLGWDNTSIPTVDYTKIDYYVFFIDGNGNNYHTELELNITIPSNT